MHTADVVAQTVLDLRASVDLRAGVTTTAATGYQHRRERKRSGGQND